jgi:hypothetical protein
LSTRDRFEKARSKIRRLVLSAETIAVGASRIVARAARPATPLAPRSSGAEGALGSKARYEQVKDKWFVFDTPAAR